MITLVSKYEYYVKNQKEFSFIFHKNKNFCYFYFIFFFLFLKITNSEQVLLSISQRCLSFNFIEQDICCFFFLFACLLLVIVVAALNAFQFYFLCCKSVSLFKQVSDSENVIICDGTNTMTGCEKNIKILLLSLIYISYFVP
jgi:hypothetical protein